MNKKQRAARKKRISHGLMHVPHDVYISCRYWTRPKNTQKLRGDVRYIMELFG